MSIKQNINRFVAGEVSNVRNEVRNEVNNAKSRIAGLAGARSSASASFGANTLRYPLVFDPADRRTAGVTYWLKVEVLKAKSKDARAFGAEARTEQKTITQTIWLYAPSLEQSDAMTYANTDVGVRGAAAIAGIRSGRSVSDIAGGTLAGAADDVASTVASLVGGGSPSIGAISTAASLTKNVPGLGGVAQAVERGIGATRNPHTMAIFQGVQLRNHKFEFSFIPVSVEEAEQVEAIVNSFRYYTYPQSISASEAFSTQTEREAAQLGEDADDISLAYIFPNTFRITAFRYDPDGGLTDLRDQGVFYNECAITAVATNFNTGAKGQSAAQSGHFTSTAMTLSFTELETLTREDLTPPK